MTLDSKTEILIEAKKKAEEYCVKNGLSLEKLATQSFYVFGNIAAFMQKMEYHGKGLLEDFESQPKQTLEYDVKGKTIRPSKYVYYLEN